MTGPVGIITGTAVDRLSGIEDAEPATVATRFGAVELTRGTLNGVSVLHLSRHGEAHRRLSHQVRFQANALALAEAGAVAVVGCTACGAVDPELRPGSLVVFDDLHFPANRLPDGQLCTVFTEPGEPGRGHWVLGAPYSPEVRRALVTGATTSPWSVQDGGVYGHVDGPRFNSVAEIAQLATAGITAVSQTGGPETVLLGELELPYALIGFVTDYANGRSPGAPTSTNELMKRVRSASDAFASVLCGAVAALAADGGTPGGTMIRLG